MQKLSLITCSENVEQYNLFCFLLLTKPCILNACVLNIKENSMKSSWDAKTKTYFFKMLNFAVVEGF